MSVKTIKYSPEILLVLVFHKDLITWFKEHVKNFFE